MKRRCRSGTSEFDQAAALGVNDGSTSSPLPFYLLFFVSEKTEPGTNRVWYVDSPVARAKPTFWA